MSKYEVPKALQEKIAGYKSKADTIKQLGNANSDASLDIIADIEKFCKENGLEAESVIFNLAGLEYQTTVVRGSTDTIDDPAELRRKLGARRWSQVVVETLDQDKLRQLMETEPDVANIVKSVTSNKPRKPSIRVTMRNRTDEQPIIPEPVKQTVKKKVVKRVKKKTIVDARKRGIR